MPVIVSCPNILLFRGDHYFLPVDLSSPRQYQEHLKDAQSLLLLALEHVLTPHTIRHDSSLPSGSLRDASLIPERHIDTAELQQILLKDITLNNNMFPSLAIRERYKGIPTLTVIRNSRICKGLGLFLAPNTVIPKDTIIAIYAGQRSTIRNPYSMELIKGCEIGGVPNRKDPWAKAAYINDYIWDEEKLNAKLVALTEVTKSSCPMVTCMTGPTLKPTTQLHCSTALS
jgi:hypothetical protein